MAYTCHHLAYIPLLLDIIQDFYHSFFGKSTTAETLTHYKHEFIHVIWILLLDNNFIEAYTHGIIV
ncbi:hypothetical protein HETIRDRAFT_174955 [Heterobasidion irregulare TC 32-1]|uniref:Uncharacterized protein n=1 Tax=Heterobasidion irregulare (strain TC 32-1) TaxID=747525 RepID=W4JTZ1_HETIT|nr:uncharacterized protein HETIRDRAFT_174955 [Heterobasidion irregulare TC 32-1]ETW76919.1 hypothetical protein HETIRDRAFT_174955 [Heterobasidion irregulare TC 32-1]